METKKEITKKEITNKNLLENKYNLDVLERNVLHLNKKYLVCTQFLTVEFCIKYILDLDIDSGSEDSYIFDKNYILEHQEHITEEEFNEAFEKYCK
jgi:hypothetical protein